MLVNDELIVHGIVVYVIFEVSLELEKESLHGGGSACVVRLTKLTPECKANGIECWR